MAYAIERIRIGVQVLEGHAQHLDEPFIEQVACLAEHLHALTDEDARQQVSRNATNWVEENESIKREDFRERLAAIDEGTRSILEAIHRKFACPHPNGGLDFTLDDRLWQAYRLVVCIDPDSIVEDLGMPMEYVAVFFAALGLRLPNKGAHPVA